LEKSIYGYDLNPKTKKIDLFGRLRPKVFDDLIGNKFPVPDVD